MIDASTDLYCVLGSPVVHSKSPLVHNASFAAHKINAVYLAFEPSDIASAVRSIKTLGIKGVSITLPFKETILDHLDWIEPQAREIGAVNTLVNQKGRLLGYNTDLNAAIDPLLIHGISGKTVGIIGAGGAARALAHGIASQGGKIIIINRSPEKGTSLARKMSGTFLPLDLMTTLQADILINTTSLGMHPHGVTSAFDSLHLTPGMVVMDVVYTPLNTRLLSLAREKGCTTIDGLSMFVAQAAAQFELWTGCHPDIHFMREAVTADPQM